MQTTIKEFAGLTCRLVDQPSEDATPEHLVILCHGFGAPGTDLVDLGRFLIRQSEAIAKRCRFVFPEAPMDLAAFGMPGGRAWWPINMAQLAEIHQTKNYEDLVTVEPEGMSAAATQLAEAVQEIQKDSGVESSSVVLGGFSQGAMVTTDVVLRHAYTPAQLILFSGTLLCRDQWQQAAANHPGCPVFQSHGHQDPILPFDPSTWLRDLLSENSFDVSFHPFQGQHEIPMPVLSEVAAILER